MIASVVKAIDILHSFSSAEPRLTSAEISRRLGLPRSTAHNLIRTLYQCGYLEKLEDDHYALGPAIIALSQSVRVNVELRDRAAPLLRELADACRESVYLAIRDGDHALYIYAVESPRRLLARSAVGDRFHLHSTGVGKAILSGLPEAEARALLERTGLPAITDRTPTDPSVLLAELAQIRKRGVAVDSEGNRPGIYCVGAPIYGAQEKVIGAVSVSGADPKIATDRLPNLSSRLLLATREISRWMGHTTALAEPTAMASAYDP